MWGGIYMTESCARYSSKIRCSAGWGGACVLSLVLQGCSSPVVLPASEEDSGEFVNCDVGNDYWVETTVAPNGWSLSFQDLLERADGKECSWVDEDWDSFPISVELFDSLPAFLFTQAPNGTCKETASANVQLEFGEDVDPVVFTADFFRVIGDRYGFQVKYGNIERSVFAALPLPDNELWYIDFSYVVPVGVAAHDSSWNGFFAVFDERSGEIVSEHWVTCE